MPPDFTPGTRSSRLSYPASDSSSDTGTSTPTTAPTPALATQLRAALVCRQHDAVKGPLGPQDPATWSYNTAPAPTWVWLRLLPRFRRRRRPTLRLPSRRRLWARLLFRLPVQLRPHLLLHLRLRLRVQGRHQLRLLPLLQFWLRRRRLRAPPRYPPQRSRAPRCHPRQSRGHYISFFLPPNSVHDPGARRCAGGPMEVPVQRYPSPSAPRPPSSSGAAIRSRT